ncbi:MAG: hypothetical protein ABGX40_02600 [Methylococcales bacterium]
MASCQLRLCAVTEPGTVYALEQQLAVILRTDSIKQYTGWFKTGHRDGTGLSAMQRQKYEKFGN